MESLFTVDSAMRRIAVSSKPASGSEAWDRPGLVPRVGLQTVLAGPPALHFRLGFAQPPWGDAGLPWAQVTSLQCAAIVFLGFYQVLSHELCEFSKPIPFLSLE